MALLLINDTMLMIPQRDTNPNNFICDINIAYCCLSVHIMKNLSPSCFSESIMAEYPNTLVL